jgi:hypothetical protein
MNSLQQGLAFGIAPRVRKITDLAKEPIRRRF